MRSIELGGLLVPLKNGRTEITAEVGQRASSRSHGEGDLIARSRSTSPTRSSRSSPDSGCIAGAATGNRPGKNGFRLSLLGFEPQVDYTALTREGHRPAHLPVGTAKESVAAQAHRGEPARRREDAFETDYATTSC